MKSMTPTPETLNKLALSLGRCPLFRGMEQALLHDIAGESGANSKSGV